jgi:DNA-binding MurR/RpiR family transcriptional regulator
VSGDVVVAISHTGARITTVELARRAAAAGATVVA